MTEWGATDGRVPLRFWGGLGDLGLMGLMGRIGLIGRPLGTYGADWGWRLMGRPYGAYGARVGVIGAG